MSSSSLQSPTSSVGDWFFQISSGLRRGGRADQLDDQSAKNAAGKLALKEEATDAATSGGARTISAVTSSCRGRAGAAMPEATVCLLLDRFAPS